VDQNGKIVIEAKHDFASPFNYGYTEFCNGCDWEKTEDEHKSIVGGTWGVMNFKGEQIASHNQKTSEKDIEIFGEYYPYPFIYSEKEKEILAFFDKQTGVLSDIYYVNYSSKIAESNKKLYFEITEKLKENFPYYRVNTYDNNKNAIDSYFEFLVSKNGKMMVKLGYKKNIPFEKWLAQAKKEIKDYQNRNKDNPNKMIKF
jgi:hypothetical protein